MEQQQADRVKAIRGLLSELREATDTKPRGSGIESITAYDDVVTKIYEHAVEVIGGKLRDSVDYELFPYSELRKEAIYYAKRRNDIIKNLLWSGNAGSMNILLAEFIHEQVLGRAMFHIREIFLSHRGYARSYFDDYYSDREMIDIFIGLIAYARLAEETSAVRAGRQNDMLLIDKMQVLLASYDDNGNKIAYEEGSHSGSGADTSTWTVKDWEEAGASSASSAAHSTTGFSICIHCARTR